MDEDGEVFLSKGEPTLRKDYRGCIKIELEYLVIDTTDIQWENSLTQRPDNI